MSALEDVLAAHIRLVQLPAPVREYRFAPTRRWRFDFAWPERKLAVEVEGGMWVRGRHNRGAGAIADMEKYAEATLAGWRVLRVSGQHVTDGTAINWIERAMHGPYGG